ncbi:MAG: CRISPR-associated helicase Cas3' [Chlorobium sp.]|nr:CRISPR-associated helicase Cas3' [Chlorobium sp.]
MLKKRTTATVDSASPLELNRCLAKTRTDTLGQVLPGRTVFSHCHIVGATARELLNRLPHWMKIAFFPEGSDLVAATHDVGKVSPTFQEKLHRVITGAPHSQPELAGVDPALERQWGGHAGLSQLTARELKLGKFIPEIIGQHHGYAPPVSTHLADDSVCGGAAWQERRADLVLSLRQALQAQYPTVTNPLQARLLAGLTTVADWIGSGSLFDDPESDWLPSIVIALDNAGFTRPIIQPGLSFSEIFDGKQPRESQQCFIDEVNQPGLYILEAPMGLGKTEAALYAAYQLLSSGKAIGLYFALPTQLTSDKIHDRTTSFLERILDPATPHRRPLLLHGNAWLKALELGKEGSPGGSWFEAGKRGILAPFAVGTIDQALMAVMNVKHGFVRTFGLAGKVVILDEVHSYDGYTGTIVEELVKALLHLHCTVIILSATLTRQRRAALTGQPALAEEYPLISALPHQGMLRERSSAAIADVTVHLSLAQKDQSVEGALQRAEEGQQVLWIENTVAEAQAVFTLLVARAGSLGIECGLLHSRFSKRDRQANEALWVHYYGQDGHATRHRCGRILVGTQVLEQSLDIDADFLVSHFAPTDMLLQRLGRLWRHADTPRPTNARREAWLLAPAWGDALSTQAGAFGATAKVYSPYVLCRSLEIWQGLDAVALPGQIRPLIERTYAPREESGEWLTMLHQLEQERVKLRRLALLGVSSGMPTLPEHKASTRYTEQDNVEVLLVRQFRVEQAPLGVTIRLPNDIAIFLPRQGRGLTSQQRRELAAQLMLNTVRVAEYLAPSPAPADTLKYLEGYLYLGKTQNGEIQLRIAKVTDSGALATLDGSSASTKYDLGYDHLGYRAEKL